MQIILSFFLIFFMIGCGSGGGGSVPSGNDPGIPRVIEFYRPVSTSTQVPLVMIMVDFNDLQVRSDDNVWEEKIFGNSSGQLNHYFNEVSYGSFQLSPAKETYGTTNDGIVKVTLTKDHPDSEILEFADKIGIDAISAADSYINFKDYDTNNNNTIEQNELQIMFLVAGGERASDPSLSPSIWGHQYCINGVSHDGVSLMQCGSGTYTTFGEKHFTLPNGPDASIGIIAHELGHGIFNLPDLYDVTSDSVGIGFFGLMGTGTWTMKQLDSEPGETPTHMCAFSKAYAGFIELQDANISTNNMALNASDSNNYIAYKVPTNDSQEYFLIENRSTTGYDQGLYSLNSRSFLGGTAIWHIDESYTQNNTNSSRLVDLEEADILLLDSSFDSGNQTNLFYAGNNAFNYSGRFTPTSTPSNSNTNNNVPTNISITNFSAPGQTMYIDLSF